MTYAIVRNSDLAVLQVYEASAQQDSSEFFSWLMCSPISTHVIVPDGSTPNILTAVSTDGVISAAQDSAKITAVAAATLANAWAIFRAQRNDVLAACDWTQGADSPLSSQLKSNWATYRQSLRDLPGAATDPSQITWPTAPSSVES